MDHDSLGTPVYPEASTPLVDRPKMSETFFSTRDFVEAWSRSFGHKCHPLAIPVRGSGPPRTMYAIQTSSAYGQRHISLAPNGLYASPGWDGQLERSTLDGILHSLTGFRTRGFIWNVRFDHEPLAAGLASLGLGFQRTSTQVVDLSKDYERVFAGFSATIRNQIRSARRRRVMVRETVDPADIFAYYQVHMRLAQQKGWRFVHPVELFLELVKLPNTVRFLVAEFEGRLLGAGLFVRDGCSVTSMQATTDRDYSRYYPDRVVYDEAIRWACESGAAFFNLGGSLGSTSLEQFKSLWGARSVLNWMFEWYNPLWAPVSHLKVAARRSLNAFRRHQI